MTSKQVLKVVTVSMVVGIIFLFVILAMLITIVISQPAKAGELGSQVEVHAFCEDLASVEAMRDVLIEADRLDWTEGTSRGDEHYRAFVLDMEDEYGCYDAQLTGLRPFLARKLLGQLLEPAVVRGCVGIIFIAVTADGKVFYTWNLDQLECA